MSIFERRVPSVRLAVHPVSGFSLTEVLVVAAIIVMLMSLAGAAVSAASSSQKKFRTRTLLAKLGSIVEAQYAAYGNRSTGASAGADRAMLLRAMARGDLPDTWETVRDLADPEKTDVADLTPHQRAYVAVWNGITDKSRVMASNTDAECLFMIIMQGGVADCLDCRGLHADIGDQDADGMPEFLDAWSTPVRFVLEPSGLRLPADSTSPFFSATLPFEAIVPSIAESTGGLMRPLVYSCGPDRESGIASHATPKAGTSAAADNLTNFDEDAKR